MNRPSIDEILTEDFTRMFGDLFQTREPGWRYFDVGRSMNQEAKRGFPMFAWEVERGPDGKYASWVWQPKGKGWDRKKSRPHVKRKDAKARALKMRNDYR